MPDIQVPIRFVQNTPLYLTINRRVVAPYERFYYDEDVGNFRIVGTVKALSLGSNKPLRRRVNLIEEISGRMIREVWSDATTGDYSFNNIRGGRSYSVVAYDYVGAYAAVIADNLTPTEMP